MREETVQERENIAREERREKEVRINSTGERRKSRGERRDYIRGERGEEIIRERRGGTIVPGQK